MSSVRGVESWQDAYIFCLQPNFQDDLWLFMIFAAIQVSLAGLKLTSFFINRWARGSKVGSGDDDEDNVGDDGASGGISIMGVLTLIAGALILAAYCDDEPDQKTYNIFKAGVYLNTFLFAVALIFICGLVVAFVVDILTRRRGRSITFRMFLGGTIVLSIAASFFGATGIMGLKYLQQDCLEEVDLYFENPESYLSQPKEYAEEELSYFNTKPTQETLYEIYEDNIIGEPYIFSEKIDSENDLYVYSVVYKSVEKRRELLAKKVKTAEFTYSNSGKLNGLLTVDTDASCFDTVGGFGETNGYLTCGVRYSQLQQAYARYEESKKKIVDREQCAHDNSDIKCDTGSPSFPLCCEQFSNEYTWTEGCACINSPTDASCKFNKDIVDCVYAMNTLDLSKTDQREYYCGSDTDGWCEKEDGTSFSWDKKCKSESDADAKLACCKDASVWSLSRKERQWFKWGQKKIMDMVPAECKQFDECHSASDYYNGCCSTFDHSDCKSCKSGPEDSTKESQHARDCGYRHCLTTTNLQEQIKCCLDVESLYTFKFPTDSVCRKAIDYDRVMIQQVSVAELAPTIVKSQMNASLIAAVARILILQPMRQLKNQRYQIVFKKLPKKLDRLIKKIIYLASTSITKLEQKAHRDLHVNRLMELWIPNVATKLLHTILLIHATVMELVLGQLHVKRFITRSVTQVMMPILNAALILETFSVMIISAHADLKTKRKI